MKTQVYIFLLFLTIQSQSAFSQSPIITELCELPSSVLETSGLENGPNDWFWTHNDSGNPAELYCVDTLGTIQRTVSVFGDANVDWEELAKDEQGNLYIGNFGNNSLNRTDLRVVKIPSIDTCTGTIYVTDTIRFSFPDQSSFPPNGTYGNFDMEAMFYCQNELHLFSKDRSDPSEGYTKHYTLPTSNGTYVASLIDSFQTGHANYIFAVTAADISENGVRMAMLSSNKIWLFSNYSGTDFFGGTVSALSLSVFSQKEGICFKNGFLYVTDEESFGLGGRMYRIDPDVFVSVSDESEKLETQPVYDSALQLQQINIGTASEQSLEWQVLDLNGKLVASGRIDGTAIMRKELPQLNHLCVLRVFSANGAATAVMIKL